MVYQVQISTPRRNKQNISQRTKKKKKWYGRTPSHTDICTRRYLIFASECELSILTASKPKKKGDSFRNRWNTTQHLYEKNRRHRCCPPFTNAHKFDDCSECFAARAPSDNCTISHIHERSSTAVRSSIYLVHDNTYHPERWPFVDNLLHAVLTFRYRVIHQARGTKNRVLVCTYTSIIRPFATRPFWGKTTCN